MRIVFIYRYSCTRSFKHTLISVKTKVRKPTATIINTNIELWCNGNTADFGSVILGSNPGSSTTLSRKIKIAFICF